MIIIIELVECSKFVILNTYAYYYHNAYNIMYIYRALSRIRILARGELRYCTVQPL